MKVDMKQIEREFKSKVSDQVRLEQEGVGRFRVFTPFTFEDGDHLVITLRQEDSQWVFSDEGHTYMHLTYDIDERDLQKGSRQKIITNVLSAFKVEDREGELRVAITDDQYGNALYSFIQALVKISDVSYLTREKVKSTFKEDFKALMSQLIPDDRRIFDWHDTKHDSKHMYGVDCMVNGMDKPLFIYALLSDDNTRDATISIQQFESWELEFNVMGIFEDQEKIGRKVLARFTNVCGRQFSGLSENEDRIQRHLGELLADAG